MSEAGIGRGLSSLLAVACKCARRLRRRNHGRCHRGPTIVSEQKQATLRARLSGTCTRKNCGMRITRNCKKRQDDAALFICDLCAHKPFPSRSSGGSKRVQAQPPAPRTVILTLLSLSSSDAPLQQKRFCRLLNSRARFESPAVRAREHEQLATEPLLLNHIYIECCVLEARRPIKIRQ